MGTAFDLSALTHTVNQTLCGAPAFIAPEVVRNDKHTTSTDIWSLGVMIYNMLTGTIPFKRCDKYALMSQIANGPMNVIYPEGFPMKFRDFIESCLEFDPEKRPTAQQLLERIPSLNSTPDDRPETSIGISMVKLSSSSDIPSKTSQISEQSVFLTTMTTSPEDSLALAESTV